MKRPAIAVFAACVLILAPARAPASDPAGNKNESFDLYNTRWWLLTVETAAVGFFTSAMYFAGDSPERCGWCSTNAFDERARTALRASDPKIPSKASDAFAYAVIPAGALAALMTPAILEKKHDWIWQDAWIAANSAILTLGVAEGIKKISARQRPAFHYGVQSKTAAAEKPWDENLSFFSGHTAVAFSVASSASTIAFLRGYKSAPYIAAFGGAAALTVGLLRISADMHWCSDVLAGAAAGTLIGAALPLLFHGRIPKSPVAVTGVSPVVGPDFKGVTIAGGF
jgi:membrane-associated phospholipid phosphatase